MSARLVHVHTVSGAFQGDMVKMFLESHGITPLVSSESVSVSYGVPGGPTGRTRVYVPVEQAELAKQLLEGLERGDFSLEDSEYSEIETPEED